MNFTTFIEEKKIAARKHNIQEIRDQIEESWVKDKIINHIKAFDGIFSYEEIRDGILNNDIIASKFCKDPSKQNISENLAAEILHLKKLPSQGKNCIRFNNYGEIVSASVGNTKSADFYLNGYYATQKYTDGEGGAQDNQRNDVIDFLTRGSIKYKVAAIVDGAYWDKYRTSLLEQFKDNPNVWITSVTELSEKI